MTTFHEPAKPCVLVIDDAGATRERLCALLVERLDVDALGCTSARPRVLAAFAELHPVCVVVDVPARSTAGFELLSELRARSAKCVFVVVSNHASDEFRQRSYAAGADYFLSKSAEFERVVPIVRELMEVC